MCVVCVGVCACDDVGSKYIIISCKTLLQQNEVKEKKKLKRT